MLQGISSFSNLTISADLRGILATEEESVYWKTSAHVPKNAISRHYKTLTLQPTYIWKYPEIFVSL